MTSGSDQKRIKHSVAFSSNARPGSSCPVRSSAFTEYPPPGQRGHPGCVVPCAIAGFADAIDTTKNTNADSRIRTQPALIKTIF